MLSRPGGHGGNRLPAGLGARTIPIDAHFITDEQLTMAFGSFDQNGGQQPMAEINTTPLVDVMLVLLVIFIITAPLFHQAVPVDLPKVDATRVDEKPQVIQLAIDGNGQTYWNGEAIHRDALPARLEAARTLNPELHLRADRATRYEKVAEVMAAAQRAGIVKIAFVTDPAGQSR